jgi:hypothetical protein
VEGELTQARVDVGHAASTRRAQETTWVGRVRRLAPGLAVCVIVVFPIWSVWNETSDAIFPGNFSIFGEMMNSIETLLFPLIAVFVSGLGFYRAMVARHVSNTRTRIGIRRLLAKRVGLAAGAAGGVFFLQTLAAFVTAHYLWPLLGNPGVDPDLSSAEAASVSYDFSFGSVLRASQQGFGLGYSVWVGLAAAAYAVLAICLLVTISNRILALAAPFLLYIASELVFELSGVPHLSFRFSTFPMGLTGSDLWLAAAPTLVLVVGVASFFAYVLHRAPTNPRLT